MYVAIGAAAVLALVLGGAAAYVLFFRAPVLGGDCGTVSPGFRDECCANRNAGNPQIMCVGRWVYDSGAGCSYRCDGTEPPVACTMEAKLCPDGSAVGRNARNNCEFDPCPGEGSGKVCGPCPQYSPPAPGWCEGGTVEAPLVDECGCRGPARCVREGGEGVLSGRVTVGPLCPVERDPPDPRCQPTEETYKAHKLVVYGVDEYGAEYVAGEFTGGADGAYSIRLPAGSYVVRTVNAGGFGSYEAAVSVTAGETSSLDVDIDTGIR